MTLIRKVLITLATGAVAFFGSNFVGETLQVTVADQLILTAIIGGITLLTQFLAEFEANLRDVALRQGRLELQRDQDLAGLRTMMTESFERITRATEFLQLVEDSKLPTPFVTQLVAQVNIIQARGAPLIKEIADLEIQRLADSMQALTDGREIVYEGEDREWLLSLARRSQVSIVATSLISGGRTDQLFEDTFWTQDLGIRYLDAQAEALEANPTMTIRRIFMLAQPMLNSDWAFNTTLRMQLEKGIDARVMVVHQVPGHLRGGIADLVVFDETVIYQTSPSARVVSGFGSATVTTRVTVDEIRAQRKARDFELLWSLATPIDQQTP